MNRAVADRVANAVLYEGYILYPYRPSVKNRQRWTFGGLYPEAYCQAQRSGDAPSSQTECLIRGSPATAVEAVVRFLHLTARQVRELIPTHVESAYEVGHLDPAPEPASAQFSPGGSAVGSQGRQPLGSGA